MHDILVSIYAKQIKVQKIKKRFIQSKHNWLLSIISIFHKHQAKTFLKNIFGYDVCFFNHISSLLAQRLAFIGLFGAVVGCTINLASAEASAVMRLSHAEVIGQFIKLYAIFLC